MDKRGDQGDSFYSVKYGILDAQMRKYNKYEGKQTTEAKRCKFPLDMFYLIVVMFFQTDEAYSNLDISRVQYNSNTPLIGQNTTNSNILSDDEYT